MLLLLEGKDGAVSGTVPQINNFFSLSSGLSFIELLKHEEVAKHNKIMFTRFKLLAKTPLYSTTCTCN